MNRAVAIAAALLSLALLAACTPRSERWEKQLESWPEEEEMGGSSFEYREYAEGHDSFEEMMAEENAVAEH